MASYLLNTNHASPLVTLHHPLRQQILLAQQAGHEFAVCVPVLNELWYGISLLPRAEQNRAEWRRLRQTIACYVPDESDGLDAAELRVQLRRGGQQLALVDSLVAIVAVRYHLILLTKDGDFQNIPRLQVENWM